MIFNNIITTRFIKNFSWLFLLNGLGYLFSLVTLPILISKFGLKELGIIFTIQAIILGITAIANYSFVYYIPTVSKQISKNDKEISNLWNLVLSIRFIISFLLSIFSTIIAFFYFNQYFLLWVLSLPILAPKIVSPTLFCNALERNKDVFKIGFFTKLLFLILIYFNDTIEFVNLYFGLSELTMILFFLGNINSNFLKPKLVDITKMLFFLKQTFNLFLVNVLSHLKPVSILPTITYLMGSEYATLYTLSEKIINIIRGVSGSVFVSFFPIYNKEKIIFKFFKIKNIASSILFSGIVIGLIYIVSPYLIFYLNNFTDSELATKTLQVLSLSTPMFFIIIPLFSHLLEYKKWNVILLFSLVQLLILVNVICIFHQNIIYIAMSVVISEYVMLACYYFFVFLLEKQKAKILM